LSNWWHSFRLDFPARRVVVLLGVLVLVCVPALTRVGQKLETASHAPSFSKNVDCPPKKVTLAATFVVALPIARKALAAVRITRFAPPLDAALNPSPFLSIPPPLRAPPSAIPA
jgi:hypothetical protein